MMKISNNKILMLGFTLIELLGVLIILAIIALITFPIIDNVLTNSRQQAYQRSIDGIIEASKMYVTSQGQVPDTNTKQLSLQTLINSGFLEDKDIIDPRNNENMTGCVVYMWDNSTNQYKYQYSEECIMTTPEECFTYKNISVVDSYDINYDTCITYFTSLDAPADMLELICTDDESYSIKDLVNQGAFTYEELEAEGVITNLEKINGIEITGYDNTCGGYDVVMPRSIDGKDIISIGDESFGNRSDSMFNNEDNDYSFINNRYIKSYMINSIDLSQVTKLETIGYAAFFKNQLTSITMPNSITYIDDAAFANNLLSNVTIPEGVTYIGYESFSNNQLTSLILPNSITMIASKAFMNNQLTSITIPNSVTHIYDAAFAGNQLTNIIIPESVEYIVSTSFVGNPWYDNNNEEFFVVNNVLLKYSGNSSEIKIPEGVKLISDYVFADRNITNVTIPEGVTYIGYESFFNNRLTSVLIPNSVIEIGYDAFSNNQLTSVTIPKNIIYLSDGAFYKDSISNPNLTNIINQTGRAFDWGSIINGVSNYYFETGTVVNSYGNVEITK